MSAADLPPLPIDPRMVYPSLSARNLDDVLFEMASHLAETGVVRDPVELAERLRRREREGCTGMGKEGVAFPHCRLQGISDVVVAGGVESVSLVQTEHAHTHRARDPWLADRVPGLYLPMLHTAELVAQRFGVTREQQDAMAWESQHRAARAVARGAFDDEIVPVAIPQRKGDPIEFRDDEGIRADTTVESLAKLRPAFTKTGTITAGTSSQISDGAAAVIVMSKAKAEELGLTWLAEIGAHGNVAGPDNSLQS